MKKEKKRVSFIEKLAKRLKLIKINFIDYKLYQIILNSNILE